jgi:hypothetical protein
MKMERTICGKALLGAACMFAACMAWGQAGSEVQEPPRVEVALTYDSALANITTGQESWMEGGSLQLQGRVWGRFGIVADIAGLHTGHLNNSATGLDLITATFGPRYTWTAAHRRVVFFGQVLVGEAHGMNGEFPTSTTLNSTANSFALQIGGGVNVPVTHRFAVRAFEANWLRTQLPNATTGVENNLRLGAGLVLGY